MFIAKKSTCTVFKNHQKCRIKRFSILAVCNSFCRSKVDLSGNTVWPQASGQNCMRLFLWFSNTVWSTWVPRFWGFQRFQIQVQFSPRNYPTSRVSQWSSNQIFWVDSSMNHPSISSVISPNALSKSNSQKWLAKFWFHWRPNSNVPIFSMIPNDLGQLWFYCWPNWVFSNWDTKR